MNYLNPSVKKHQDLIDHNKKVEEDSKNFDDDLDKSLKKSLSDISKVNTDYDKFKQQTNTLKIYEDETEWLAAPGETLIEDNVVDKYTKTVALTKLQLIESIIDFADIDIDIDSLIDMDTLVEYDINKSDFLDASMPESTDIPMKTLSDVLFVSSGLKETVDYSEWFNIEDFYVPSGRSHNVDNTPPNWAMDNLKKLIRTVLVPVCKKLGKKLDISSGYRCPKINADVGGAKNSQHMYGEAADIHLVGGTTAELFDALYKMIDNKEIEVGQLIWEYGNSSAPQWVHVSIPNKNKLNEIISIGSTLPSKYKRGRLR